MSTTETSTVGRRLAYYRAQRGMTQRELAERSGLTKRMVEKYEADVVHPSLESFAKIVKVLELPAEYVLPDVQLPGKDGKDG